MNNLNFRETILLAKDIYKKSLKLSFGLAFILSFITQFCLLYLLRHGLTKFIQSGGQTEAINFPSGGILLAIVVVIIVTTIFVYSMIIILQGLFVKHELKSSDAFKIALQMFYKRVFAFIGTILLYGIVFSALSLFLQYIGAFITTILFLTVFPRVLLDKKDVLSAIASNFNIMRANFFYFVKLALVIIVATIVKSLVIFSIIYLLKSLNIGINPVGVNIQNILIIIVNSLFIPFISSISVATFFYYKNKEAY